MIRKRGISEAIQAAYEQYMHEDHKGPWDIDDFADAIKTMIENAIDAYNDHEKAAQGFGPLDVGYHNPNTEFIDWWYRTYVLGEEES